MDSSSDFQQKLVEYLKSVYVGEFLTGTKEEVEDKLKAEKEQNKNYQDPTQNLPELPPPLCKKDDCASCCNYENMTSWWDKFKNVVDDDLILRSNIHNCRVYKGDEKIAKKNRPLCINKYGNCKAQFPRTLYEQTQVDPKTGALNIKKGEAWINTLTPVITYLL